MKKMDDFVVQCERLVKLEEEDINTSGWKQANQLFAWMMYAVSEASNEVEIRITGSSVEGGKHVWADDIGDTDIIICRKRPDDIVELSLLADMPQHPGFVKVKHEDGYLKTISLKETIPPGIDALIHYFQGMIKSDGSLTVTENAGSPATQINFLSKMPALSSQWDNMGEVSDNDITLSKSVLRIFFRDKTDEEREKNIEEITGAFINASAVQPRGDVNTMAQFFGKMILTVAEKMQAVQNNDAKSQQPQQSSQQPQPTQPATEQLRPTQSATQEPHPTQPATEQPKPTQPTTEQPRPTQSATQQPQPTQPATEQPKPTQPATEQPQPTQSATQQPQPTQSATQQPQPTQPAIEQPQPTQSATQQPQPTQSATQQPQPTQPATQTRPSQQPSQQPEIQGVPTDATKQKLENYIINRMTNKLFDTKHSNEDPSEDQNKYIRKVGIDLVKAKKVNGWPLIAKEFCDRPTRIYPTTKVFDKILESCIYIVAKEPVNVSEEEKEYCFRYSFSHSEQILFEEMGEVPRLCFRIMKIIHHAIFKELCDGENPFKSYHIKTLLFWALEVNEAETWTIENLQDCISLLLINLMTTLEEQKLEHYFIPDINLFQHFTSDQLEEMLQCVLSILEDIPETLRKVEKEFLDKSKLVSQQTKDLLDTDTQQNSNDSSFATFYETWSKAYDEITTQFIHHVLSPDQENTNQFPSDLVALFQKGNMSKEMLIKVFTTFKMTSYQKHVFNSRDVKRPINDVIMDDIASAGKLLKWVLQKPIERLTNELVSDENLNREILDDIELGDPIVLEAIDSILPDSNEMVNTFMNFTDFK